MDFQTDLALAGIAAVLLAVGLLAGVRKLYRGKRETKGRGQSGHETAREPTFGLVGSRRGLWQSVLARGTDASKTLGALEEVLLGADVGARATQRILTRVQEAGCSSVSARTIRERLAEVMTQILTVPNPRAESANGRPRVVFLIGVNGVGKTTTVAKLAHWYRERGQRVLIVAGDTFRAAAVEQLEVWARRIGVELVRQKVGSDPGAVLFDGLNAALARQVDVVLVDTAGRLHAKKNLMEELRKLARVAARAIPGAPHDVWLVLDATVGQNGLVQARSFTEAVRLTGLVLTKLDGTAKGGIVLAIVDELRVPIVFVGTGEKLSDLQPFDPTSFVETLLGEEPAETTSSSSASAA